MDALRQTAESGIEKLTEPIIVGERESKYTGKITLIIMGI